MVEVTAKVLRNIIIGIAAVLAMVLIALAFYAALQ